MEPETRLSILNPEPQLLPGPSLLHHLVFGGEGSGADQPALDYRAPDGQHTVLSYAQLHQAACVLAAEISRRLASCPSSREPETAPTASAASTVPSEKQQLVVPMIIPQAPELYVSMLAILKTGGAFCAIQLDAPPDRIRFILGDVATSVLLTTRDMAAKLPPDLGLQIVLVDELDLFRPSGHDAPDLAPARQPSPDDYAYVMYTSGSTGTPKGVGVPHTAATQSLLAHHRHVPTFTRFLNFAAPTFDVSVFEIFFPWFRGATLVSCSRAELLNDLPAVLRSMHVDACELTPTVAGSLLRTRDSAPDLRLLLTIGEMLTEPVVCEFGDAPGRPSILWGMYGPTEAAIHCTLLPAMQGDASVRSIGFPLDTVSSYILEIPPEGQAAPDAAGGDPKVVPLGEVGELAVGGHQLACGYINRPEQTAAAFIDTEKYGRLYRTGDKARITEQGLMECYGRLSGGQVKLRGQRIELGEVEQAVLRTSGCLGAVAAVIHGILVAFCDIGPSVDSSEDGLEDKILESCKSWLPRFMIPGDFVLMKEFPRLASGKVDRKRLAAEYTSAHQPTSETPAETKTYRDDLDRLLHDITRDILATDIESTAPLSAAGLDSLQSIRFAAALRSGGFHHVSAVDVLQAKTLFDLHDIVQNLPQQQQASPEKGDELLLSSARLDVGAVAAGVPALRDVPGEAIELVSECTPVQTAMLAETLADPKAYCNWVELAFAQEYSADDVEAAFERVIAKNGALRTGFVQHDGRFVQVVMRHGFPNQVWQVGTLTRDFRLETEDEFLCPFHVEIQPAASAVRAVLRIHHAVYDGWSMDLIRTDLEHVLRDSSYDAARPSFAPVVRHYRSVSADQTDAARQYWAQALHGFQPSPLPELNWCLVPSHVRTRTSSLSQAELSGLEAVSRALECSTQVFFQAAAAWLWSSLLGVQDVVMGTVTSGRTLPVDGIEAVVGPCLQTVPLRADLSRMRNIRDLLDSLQSANRSLLPHAFLPLAEIKKTSGLRPGQPLYDLLFVYQESLYSQKSQSDAVVEVAHQDYLETKLLWEVEPDSQGGGGFRVRATFHSDVFPDEQVASMLGQFACIVHCIVSSVESELSAIQSSFTPELLSCWNVHPGTFDGITDLARLVEGTVRRVPDQPAVCVATAFEGDDHAVSQTFTYRELNELANRIARHLQSAGAAVGDPVAILLNKSIFLYAGILGILKAGCAYLPIIPTLPAARASMIVKQAGVRYCLTDTAMLESLVRHLPVKAVDLQTIQLDRFAGSDLEVPADPSRPAYLIYTSGSTGVPKGVCVTQRSVNSNLDTLNRYYPQRDGGRFLQSCSPGFDVSVFEIFFTWLRGMCLCAATNDVLFEDLERTIRGFQVTHLSMTTTVASLVDPKNTPSVEFLVAAGETLTESVIRTWHEMMYQGYGPSELTNICTVKRVQAHDNVRHIGTALDNCFSAVLQFDGLEPVPRGAIGELCFGGDQVAAGYLHLPDLTAKKFVQHPTYGRLYRTGDMGRMLYDGSLMMMGRLDDQVKLRGQRIELDEINAVLQASGLLSESLTLLIHHEDAKSELLASFFVPSGSSVSSSSAVHVLDPSSASFSTLTGELFRALQSRLPSYMVPTHVIPISSMPMTPAGKADRSALRALFQTLSPAALSATSSSSSATADVDSDDGVQWSEMEKQIARLVSETLGADARSIGRWTPLPSLGLDSISAIRVSRLLSQAFGQQRLAISDILKNASVARLAQMLGGKSTASASASASTDAAAIYSLDVFAPAFVSELQKELGVRGHVFGKVMPCTPLQEAMLVSPTRGKSYLNHMLFRLHAGADQLKSTWFHMCRRHEILRTCFVTTDNAQHPIAQIVLEQWTPSWLELGDGTKSTPSSLESLVDEHVHSLANPVDSYQPPVSFAVIHQPEGCYLSFICHHAVYDGGAMSRLLFEAEQDARGLPLLPSAPLPFSAFLERALALPQSTEAFWKRHLAGFVPTLLQQTSSTPGSSRIHAAKLRLPLSALQGSAKQLGVSLLTACQGTWAVVLGVLAGVDDVCFGNVYSGRSLPLDGLEELVAPCFNTLPVRAQLSALRSSKDLLAYFQALNPDLMQHQFTPLRHTQRQHRSGGHLFDSLLLLQQPSEPLDESIWTLERDDGEMDFTLVCELVPDPLRDVMELRLHHDTSYLSDAGAALISELFETLADTLLHFSSSHIPSRKDLLPAVQTQLEQLDLQFDRPLVEISEEPSAASALPDEIWSTTESAIRAVLSHLSGVPADSIRRDTTIYRLGLDSVRAVQVASMLRKQGLSVSAVDVMEYPSCRGLSLLITGSGTLTTSAVSTALSVQPTSSGSVSSAPSTPPAPDVYDFARIKALAQPSLDKTALPASSIEAILPCTPLQTGLIAEFLRSKGQHYFNFIAFHSDALDADSWARAWSQTTAATPMLRTGFVSIDNDEDPDTIPPFVMVQLKAVTSSPAGISIVRRHQQQQLKLNAGKWQHDVTQRSLAHLEQPPWHAAIVEDSAGSGVTCYLAIHHGLYDATSLQGILDRVARRAVGKSEWLSVGTVPSSIETVVSDIFHQVAVSTAPSSDVATSWKAQGTRAVVNTFPVLTPLKALSPTVKVAAQSSSRSFQDVTDAARHAGFTVHSVLQAAWTRILSSYLGDAAVVFGAVLSGRSTEATSSALFPCLSTLPVIAENRSSNRQLVEEMMSLNILLHKSQHIPLNQIQKWLGQADARLFDTLLVYQNTEAETEAHPWKVVDEKAVVDYPISLEVIPHASGGSLEYQITYDTGVLPEEHASLLLRQFDAVVSHLVFQPDGHEDDLVAADASLFSALPAAHAELPSEVKLMHEFVEVQAQRIPDKLALRFVTAFESDGRPVSREWTYATLNDRGNKVASLVASHGVEPGSIVAVCYDKCPEAFFAILGILKAGCSFVALDPGAPPSRKEFILQDSQAALLLTDVSRARAPSAATGLFDAKLGVPVVAIEEAVLARSPVPAADAPLSAGRRATLPSDICYCLYTSGTTGTPKGCAITHENAVQALLAFQALFRGHWEADSRWLQFASFHFDVSVLEQYWSWSVGIVLVGAPRDLILEDLAGTIARLGITHIDLTPSLGRLLDPADVPSLCRGVFITGGEPLKQEMLDAWGPTGAVHNFYGPTEATIGVTSFPQVPRNGRASNIGKQFPNVGSLVLRPGTEIPVLRGGVGELCVSGKLVGQGYLHRADLTSERFPTLRSGERIYRTGDLVRVLHDGCFDFLGRADDQVKLRGQRLEIGEINHAIRLGVASVDDAATLVIRDEANKKDFLVSFVVTPGAATSTKADGFLKAVLSDEAVVLSRRVQAACRERLPGYMVPTYVVQLTFMPLSANNKAEARELRRLFQSLSPEDRMKTTGASGASGTTDTTARDAGLFSSATGQKVLGVLRQLGAVDRDEELLPPVTSIFDLGIDSISVLRLARALKRAGLPAATPSLILAHPVLSSLVEALEAQETQTAMGSTLEARLAVEACQHHNRSQVCDALGVRPDEIEYIAPCSALQQGMISRSRSGQDHRDTYFNAFYFHLRESTSAAQLEAAWQTLLAAHAILRTRFVATRDGFVQVALKAAPSWTHVDLGEGENIDAVLAERQQAWVQANQEDVISTPLQLLSATCRGKTTVVLHIFHALYDATSLDLILAHVAAAYEGTSTPTPTPTFLEALVHGPLRNHASSRAFWEDHLKGHVFTPLPVLSAERQTHKTTTAKRTVSFDGIDSLRSTLGVTHSALVQALWVSVLQKRYGGRGGITLGLVLSGRTMDDLDHVEGVIGPLFNTLPFYSPLARGKTWASLSQACHAFNTTTLPFQQVPLRDIQKWCSAGQPLFDVLLSFQFADSAPRQSLWQQSEPDAHADYPLALEVDLDSADGHAASLRFLVVAKGEHADEATLDLILDDLEAAVAALSKDPQGRIATIEGEGDESAAAAAHGPTGETAEAAEAAIHEAASRPPFDWSEQALTLRREMALLGSVSLEAVREDTTLLELGLDSVDTIKLSARLRAAGIRLANSQLIRGQRISEFVKMIAPETANDAHNSSAAAAASQIDAISTALKQCLVQNGRDLASVEDVLPPTPLQEAIVADMIQSDFTRYFNHDILELATDVDVNRLKDAWLSVVRTHPILRTVFYPTESAEVATTYCQVIKRDVDGGLVAEHAVASQDQLVGLVERAKERAIQAQAESDLLQLAFVHVAAEDRWYLVLSISHALYDGWSLGLLHRRVASAYQSGGVSGSQDAESYKNALGRMLQSSGPRAQEFWRSFLADARPTLVQQQVDQPRETKSVERAEAASSVPVADLLQFCREQSTSAQVVGQACWAAVLSRLTRSLDVVFGVVLSGRDAEGADELMFPTMNTVPVRVVLHGTASELLQYMQANMGHISEHQQYSLRDAQKAVAGRGGDSSGILNTLFIFQKRLLDAPTSSPEQSSPLMRSVQGISDVEYPICVEMEVVQDDMIVWRTACDSAYVSTDKVAHLLHELDSALAFFIQSSISPESNHVLRFEEGGISACGLAPYAPNLDKHKEDWSAGSPSAPESAEPADTPWSADEEAIREVLSSVSGLPIDAIHKTGQTVYHLGLDSISTIKVSALLRKTKGIALGVRDLLAAASIEDMALRAAAKHATTVSNDTGSLSALLASVEADKLLQDAGMPSSSVESVLPATAMQVHMISAWQNASGAVFFPEFHHRLRGASLDRQAIFSAWTGLVQEFPVLRTVFLATPSKKVPLLQIVLRSTVREESAASEWPASEHKALAILSVAADDGGFLLTLKIHHALYDAVSLQAILERLRQLCAGAPPSPAATAPAWTQLLSLQASDATKRRQQAFWSQHLQEARQLPVTPPKAQPSTDAGRTSLFQPKALSNVASLQTAASRHGVSLQSVLFAAYAKVLSQERDTRDVVFGFYLANRDDEDKLTHYPTLCLVPLFVSRPQQRSLFDVASQVQKDIHAMSSSSLATAGLWEIQEWTGITVDTFVNFLLPPDERAVGAEDPFNNVTLEEIQHGPLLATDCSPPSFADLQGNPVRDAYPVAIDIEVAVRGAHLDVGVFGPASQIGQDEAAQLIARLVAVVSSDALSV